VIMKRGLVLVLVLVVGACPGKQATGGGSTGGSGSGPAGSRCEAARAAVERLYRAEATEPDPTRLATWVADNTTMVLNDCVKDPGKRVPCIQRATSVAELESKCVSPLDDEGTEGEELRP